MHEAEAVIIGAGPAGATLALNLAPTRRVVLVERRCEAAPRIGESLPPSARRLLSDMGLIESFDAEGHAPCHGNRIVWGDAAPVETDFLRDPDGHGWHLDRARFDAWLRRTAVERSAQLIAPARVERITRDGGTWRVSLATAAGSTMIAAGVLIDAGGRTAPLARRLRARRRAHDRLVCGWIHGDLAAADREAGLTYVEASEQGWWYTAPLPGRRRVLAFHTDADLPAAEIARDRHALLGCAARHRELAALLANCGFAPTAISGFTAAHSSVLSPCAGPGWLAVGDAGLAFDPLSAQGLFNALFTGLAAAEAADRHLAGVEDAVPDYILTIDRIRDAYRRDLSVWYRHETRWPDNLFWRRRQSPQH